MHVEKQILLTNHSYSCITGKRQVPSRTQKVLALSIGQALTTLASLATLMVASRFLTKYDYATYKQTFLAYDFAASFLMLGLPNALFYFLPRAKSGQQKLIGATLLLLIMAGGIFSIFILLGGAQVLSLRFANPNLSETMLWLIPYPFFVMPAACLSAVLVFTEHTFRLSIYNIFAALLQGLVVVAAMLYFRDYKSAVIAKVVVAGILLPIAVKLMFSVTNGKLQFPEMHFLFNILRYSLPLGMASMLGNIMVQFHSIIVSSLCPPEQFAVYINGAIEVPLISIITGSITTVVFAEMSTLCHTGNKESALELFHKASIKSATILFPTMCFLLANAKSFIVIVCSEEYIASAVPFAIYLLALPIRIVVYGSALMALGMTRTILIRSVIDLGVNGILCYLFVSWLGYIGAAIALIVSLYIWHVPFNLLKIAEGFSVRMKRVLPFKSLAYQMFVSVICLPLAVIPLFFNISAFYSLLLSALLYCPAIVVIMARTGYIELSNLLTKRTCRI